METWNCIHRLTVLMSLFFGLVGITAAQEHSIRPGINRHYENPVFDQWVATFENPGREIFNKRHAVVQASGLSAGMVVADVGAGTGLFTLLFARQVAPGGRVLAVDISDTFVTNIVRRARAWGLNNVTGVVNKPTEVSLPSESIDLAFVCDTYHHFEYPQKMLSSIHRALRPGGALIIIDFRRQPGISSPWVLRHVRAGEEDVVREVEGGGFRLVGKEHFLQENYFLRFEKR